MIIRMEHNGSIERMPLYDVQCSAISAMLIRLFPGLIKCTATQVQKAKIENVIFFLLSLFPVTLNFYVFHDIVPLGFPTEWNIEYSLV